MTIRNLDFLFNPRSLVLIGASSLTPGVIADLVFVLRFSRRVE